MRKKQRLLRYYPLAVKLSKRDVLVIGGGRVAERKVYALREAGAKIRVVSPKATPALIQMARQNSIKWIRRPVQNTDLRDAYLVIAATNNKNTNEAISRWARKRGIWTNVVDKPLLSDFISPAVFRTGNSIITVYTDGKDPVLSRDVKNFLKERWDDFLSYRNRL